MRLNARSNISDPICFFQFVFVASLEVSTGIPLIGVEAKLGISVEKNVNIGTTEKQSVLDTQNWTAEYPSAIPAESTYV